jgi:hypothetical protein
MQAEWRNKVMLQHIRIAKNNSQIFVDVSGAPIHNKNNETIGGVILFKDVSKKKNWN